MKPIASTAEILAFKVLGRNINKKWVDWAYGMLLAGFETEDLLILAGETEPYNQFELQRLTDKILKELGLVWDDREQVLKNYVCYLVDKTLSEEMKVVNVLDILKDIYIELDYEPLFNKFYLLYYANDDLIRYGQQWYWDGATRENIDTIIKDYFIEWRTEY